MSPNPPERLVVCASHSPGKERDHAERFGASFRAGLAAAADEVARFDPDLVVLFGGDHRRAFRTIVPAFAVALSATIIAEGRHPADELAVPAPHATSMSEYLLAEGFDVAVCRSIALDHAFAQPLRDLLGSCTAKPVIPVPINCATPPLPTARRIVQFASAIGRFLDGVDARVLVIGTGGLSHAPPSLEVDTYDLSDEERARLIAEGMAQARTKIRPDWDHEVLHAFSIFDVATLERLVDGARDRAGSGANEVRTWLAAGVAGGCEPLKTRVYEPVPEWITGMAVATTA